MHSLAHGLPGGMQAQGKSRRCRPGSLALGVGQPLVYPHALGGAQCGEQRGPDHKHSQTKPSRTFR